MFAERDLEALSFYVKTNEVESRLTFLHVDTFYIDQDHARRA